MRLFKTTSAELLERAEAKAKADAASSPDRHPPDRRNDRESEDSIAVESL